MFCVNRKSEYYTVHSLISVSDTVFLNNVKRNRTNEHERACFSHAICCRPWPSVFFCFFLNLFCIFFFRLVFPNTEEFFCCFEPTQGLQFMTPVISINTLLLSIVRVYWCVFHQTAAIGKFTIIKYILYII